MIRLECNLKIKIDCKTRLTILYTKAKKIDLEKDIKNNPNTE